MNSDDKSILVGLVLMAIFAFLGSVVMSVAIVAHSIERVMIAYFPAVPLIFGQITFIIFTAIVLFFIYKLFSTRWFYDYKKFKNGYRKEY